jgi:transposase-like protein
VSTDIPPIVPPSTGRQPQPRQLLAARLLVQGKSYGAVAEQLGVSPRTVFNWRRSPAFQSLIAAEVANQSRQTTPKVQSALNTLQHLLANN